MLDLRWVNYSLYRDLYYGSYSSVCPYLIQPPREPFRAPQEPQTNKEVYSFQQKGRLIDTIA